MLLNFHQLRVSQFHQVLINADEDDKFCFEYGKMLYYGDGIEENKELAAEYFKNAKSIPDSLYICAQMLYNGDGIDVNKKEAAYLFLDASDYGHAEASNVYGYLLITGNGVDVDKEKAALLFRKADYCESLDVMYNYAVILLNEDIT